ncbi:hypothetical protein SAMN02745121_07164 [Nannocystis exedens]|uniref:Uncharacterized protein n=1 Tax=Nannocystis exedens TaxID=54 RepID=A0A1I2GC15_9BACT|nr:hypothetical protein [Nannocystis exedens]PCC67403.1 hypothetical protein NAEX_00409 [Nannocystis exedens]SFF14467.1 hypothetical protein SAMN02745121_07164 [Nannocystis exedens]
MQSQQMIQALAQITSDFRRGDLDAAYQGYRDLFSNPAFAQGSAEARRHALRQFVHTQGAPTELTRTMRVAHDAAVGPLQALIAESDDPGDRELLKTLKQRLG